MFKDIFNESKREYKQYQKKVEKTKEIIELLKSESDEDLITIYKVSINRNEILAIASIFSERVLGLKPHDVQLLGALVLSEGKIAEMKTGEGKTLVAALSALLKAKEGQVHIITVNDYLAKRDSSEMKPLFEKLELSVGNINGEGVNIREEYSKNIVYGVHQNFVNNYLRNNMFYKEIAILPISFEYCIVDEIDSVLIDEARTPITISGQKSTNIDLYIKCKEIVKELDEKDYHIEGFDVKLTDRGVKRVEELFEIDNIYTKKEAEKAHHMEQTLKAHFLMNKNVDYIIKNNEIVVIDSLSGRLQPGRRFSEGIHQAIECKEDLGIQFESQPYARITYQNYFRLYKDLSGMTGTAKTEEEEFKVIYKLPVVEIETNKPIQRIDHLDVVYLTKKAKYKHIIKKVREVSRKGQPILIGTASIESSEEISRLLKEEDIIHEVLNAKNHEREAEIISKAGEKGNITVATNMAGRGVDIKISKEVESLGGLFVLGVERYENRRIDNQLRGRTGRQGDNGESIFYLSLEDDLIIKNGGEKIKLMIERFSSLSENDNLNNKSITKSIENIQKRLEGNSFDLRKHILEYDDIMNEHRIVFYKYREDLLLKKINIQDKTKEYCEYYNNYIKGLEKKEEELEILGINNESELREKYFNKVSLLKESNEDIERQLALHLLDKSWAEHIYKMDLMKRGISLRSYNAKDPLSEYKKESFILLEELINNFKISLIKYIFNYKIPEKKDEILKEENSTKSINNENKSENLQNSEKKQELIVNDDNLKIDNSIDLDEKNYPVKSENTDFLEKKAKRLEKRKKKMKNYLKT